MIYDEDEFPERDEAEEEARADYEREKFKHRKELAHHEDCEPLSNCCEAQANGEITEGFGRCCACGEMAQFE